MPMNEMIAQSGAKLYEQARKGFVERPDEARARQMQELQMRGEEQNQRLGELNILQKQGTLDEWEQGATGRELQREELERANQPDVLEASRRAATERAQADLDAVRSGIAKEEADIAKMTDEKAAAEKALAKSEYAKIILGATRQASVEESVAFIKDNFDALIKAGDDEEDKRTKAILAAPPEEQARLIKGLQAAAGEIEAHQRKMEIQGAKGGQLGTDKQLAALRDQVTSNEAQGLDKHAGLQPSQIKVLNTADRKEAGKLLGENFAFLRAPLDEKIVMLNETVEALGATPEAAKKVLDAAKKAAGDAIEESKWQEIWKELKAKFSSKDIKSIPEGTKEAGFAADGRKVFKVDGKFVYQDGTTWSK